MKGIEDVDPLELEKQRALTAALWSRLLEQRVAVGAPGVIQCYFFAPGDAEVPRLTAGFPDWECAVTDCDKSEYRRMVRLTTPQVQLTREAFLELVEVAMIAAHRSSCRFDGFQVETFLIRKKGFGKSVLAAVVRYPSSNCLPRSPAFH